ncbi:spore germination protein [Brevibacillus agri]|uniref:spore germination protein n=1 Tax=Brevibacillus agri TaxID=51101 RepID=UPI0018CCE53A|nr:spore germination protein [Brevibacillus agri]MBG9564502.1 membrane protein [Brevibacillus agri]
MSRNARKWWRSHKQRVQQQQAVPSHTPLHRELAENEQQLRALYANCADVVFRSFRIGGSTRALAIYIQGLTNNEELERTVLSVLMKTKLPKDSAISKLLDNVVSVSKTHELATFEDCLESVANGYPILLIDQQQRALSFGLARWEKRQIEEPMAEVVVRGPREGFTESLQVNTALLRRLIKTPALKMEQMQIGGYTKTQVVLAYVDGLVDADLVTEVRARLNRIDIDGVLESGYIEEMIEDYPASPFPQILTTERPDVTCGNLLEGRIAILVDGTPFVMIAPTTLFSLLQSSEDYYQRSIASTAIRWLRYLFTVISFLLPSLYVALITYHHEMVPTSLLISMAASREPVPFPALVEALLMEITFEALREAGVRLPKQVGAAVSIVGALVIGQAAVQAGLVSAPMVIVVAITGIASFMIPHYIAGISIRLLRFPLMFLAGTLGLLGIMLGIIVTVIHLSTIRSLGVPYLTPVGPMKFSEWKDTIVRAPWWMMNERPHLTGDYQKIRQGADQKPGPEKGGDPA